MAPAKADWRLECFGALRAVRGPECIEKFRTQKIAAVLALLTLRGGRSREGEASEAINARLIESLERQADPYARVFTSATVGVMACDSGRLERALLVPSTLEFLSIGTRWDANTVVAAGELAVKLGRQETAALIFGATEAMCERAGYILVGCMAHQYEAALQELHSRLDEATLSAAWARGRRMSDEEAVAVTQELG